MDLLANQVVFMFNNMQSSLPYIHDGRLKALGVTSAERLNILPNVPTFKELGFKKLEFTGWYGLLGPAGLPQSITNTLNDLLQSILRERNIADQIRLLGAEPRFGTPKDFQEQINSDINRWSELIKQSNIKGL
jgi:tripartite-type tricarboxylate transporter receptor subunit TctC